MDPRVVDQRAQVGVLIDERHHDCQALVQVVGRPLQPAAVRGPHLAEGVVERVDIVAK